MGQQGRAREFDTVTIAGFAAIALLIELVLLRVATRTAINIPGLGEIEIGFRVVSELGRLAFNAAVILVAATIVGLLLTAASRRRWALVGVLGAFLAAAVAAPLDLVSEPATDVVIVLAIVAVPILGVISRDTPVVRVIPSFLFAAAFAVAAVPTIVGKTVPGTTLPVTGILTVAELLALAAAASLVILVWGRPQRRPVVISVLTGGALAGLLAAQPATIETLMLWNLGLAGYFGPVAYGAAFGAALYAALTALGRKDRLTAIGIACLVAGGIGLHSTLQSASVFIGVLALSQSNSFRATATRRTDVAAAPPTAPKASVIAG
ncbi:MAG: hypothetical protein R2823_05305 [Acidimicrobiia bacterium]